MNCSYYFSKYKLKCIKISDEKNIYGNQVLGNDGKLKHEFRLLLASPRFKFPICITSDKMEEILYCALSMNLGYDKDLFEIENIVFSRNRREIIEIGKEIIRGESRFISIVINLKDKIQPLEIRSNEIEEEEEGSLESIRKKMKKVKSEVKYEFNSVNMKIIELLTYDIEDDSLDLVKIIKVVKDEMKEIVTYATGEKLFTKLKIESIYKYLSLLPDFHQHNDKLVNPRVLIIIRFYKLFIGVFLHQVFIEKGIEFYEKEENNKDFMVISTLNKLKERDLFGIDEFSLQSIS